MINDNGLKNIKTIDLLKILIDAYDKDDQNLINIYAYEIAYRIYSVKRDASFCELLYEFGYKNDHKKLTR